MKKFFIEKDLKEILGWLGLGYKKSIRKRIFSSLLITILIFLLGLFLKNIPIQIFSIPVFFLYYKYQYYDIKKKRNKFIIIKKRMFPSFMKKLLILIKTNNIYQALNKLVEYTDEPIKKYLIELINDIDVDKSIKPYIKFAKKMEFSEAYQVMIVIYTFSEHSMKKEYLISLEKMISRLYDNEIEELIEKKKRFLWLLPNMTIVTMLVLIFSLALYMFSNIFSEVKF
ncbi:MAG: hypothetical protein PHR25_02070 [Clostridia bacterium]|nr:hypothetical protein [Clostridia bacterium]